MFHINPYFYRVELTKLKCKSCGKAFLKQMFSSRKISGRGQFCSKECVNDSRTSKNFNVKNLLFNWKKYKFLEIGKEIGNYDSLKLGFRAKQFVNRNKFDPILNSADPLQMVSAQKYAKKRITSSLIKFKDFQYRGDFKLDKDIAGCGCHIHQSLESNSNSNNVLRNIAIKKS